MNFDDISSDTPNVYITKQMLKELEPCLTPFHDLFERIPTKGIRKLLEKLHIVHPCYLPKETPPTSKTLRVKRCTRLYLPS